MQGYGEVQAAIVALLEAARRAVARSINAVACTEDLPDTVWQIFPLRDSPDAVKRIYGWSLGLALAARNRRLVRLGEGISAAVVSLRETAIS
jgi:hypothetical protein